MKNIFEIKDNVLVHCTVNTNHVDVPEGVTTIASNAFCKPGDTLNGQDKLVSISLPTSVVRVENDAFYDCIYLESVEVLGPATLGYHAFFGCDRLHDVYLADGVVGLDSECFAYCENLQTLFIPKSVKHVGRDIACQNDGYIQSPYFYCQSKGMGADWDSKWNRIYVDPRFNDLRNTSFHYVCYGMSRSGFTQAAEDWAWGPNKWADLFDEIYTPKFPDDKKLRRRLENVFYNSSVINRLRPDQVERIRKDSQDHSNATACYLYAYWLLWNATSLAQMDDVEVLASAAAQAGYGDMWMLLRYMWNFGQNIEARIDKCRVAECERLALATDSELAFDILKVSPVLYGENPNPEKALEMTFQWMLDEGGEEVASPSILKLVGECYLEMGDKEKAKLYINKAIERGGMDSSFRLLFIATCFDNGEWTADGKEKAKEIYKDAADAGVAWGLFWYGMEQKDNSLLWSDFRKRLYQNLYREFVEKAALLGNGDACMELCMSANSGTNGFHGEHVITAYPYLLRGAMTGHKECAYWLCRYQEVALDSEKDPIDREMNLPRRFSRTPAMWRSYAQALYESEGEEWPNYEYEEYEDLEDQQ